jgi:undecaprenyl-diphosphatase
MDVQPLEERIHAMFSQMDYGLFVDINNLAVTHAFFNPVMVFLSQYGEYLFYLGIVLYWFSRSSKIRRMVTEALLSATIALGINALIGIFLYRDRPFVHHHVIQLIQHAANASFPSDHATGAFVIATAIWMFRKRDGWLWLLLASGISFSRIWTGVHYPSDVIAGMIIGISIATIIHGLLIRWKGIDQFVNKCIGFYEDIEKRIWKENKKHHPIH